MSRQPRRYPVASTSYQVPPREQLHRHANGAPIMAARSHDLPGDVYIPASDEERNRMGIESRLLQPNAPTYRPDELRGDATSASSVWDSYDLIGREDRRPPTSRAPASALPARHAEGFDESLIPGVGRGLRSDQVPQSSYHEQLRGLRQHTSHLTSSSHPSPYHPGKYRDGYGAARNHSSRPTTAASATARMPVTTSSARKAAPSATQMRHAQVDTASETENGDSGTDSADSDDNCNEYGSVQSTGNHRNFAATEAGQTATMTGNFRPRPRLGEDTLNRIEFDLYTDTDSERRTRSATAPAPRQTRQSDVKAAPCHDPLGPFASPRPANTFGMNAANYQQHLASRTLTSPALRTLIGDRSRSPDSPTPAPSVDGMLPPRKGIRRDEAISDKVQPLQQGQAVRQAPLVRDRSNSAVSSFADLARKLQRDVDLTRRGAEGAAAVAPGTGNDDAEEHGSQSNSGGSGFGPGSQASSARTRVEANQVRGVKPSTSSLHFNGHGYPSYAKPTARAVSPSPFAVRLPDITGLTSALCSPERGREGMQHRGFDEGVGSQKARLEELANLRSFVEGIQTELDRAGERIMNLEETQELQAHEVHDLRSEMQNVIRDVRTKQSTSDSQLIEIVLERLEKQQRLSAEDRAQVNENAPQGPSQSTAATNTVQQESQSAAAPVAEPHYAAETKTLASRIETALAPPQERQSAPKTNSETVDRLYSELNKLRAAMDEQFRNAAAAMDEQFRNAAATYTEAYEGQVKYPSAAEKANQATHPKAGAATEAISTRDPWEAIEALRLQVANLSHEVDSLNGMVYEQLCAPKERVGDAERPGERAQYFAATSSAAHLRHEQAFERRDHRKPVFNSHRRLRDDLHPASDPVFPTTQFAAPMRSSTPPPRHGGLAQNAGMETRHQQYDRPGYVEDDDYDRTLNAVAENIRFQKAQQAQRRRQQLEDELIRAEEEAEQLRQQRREVEQDEFEISQLAEARATRASARVARASELAGQDHDAQVCSVCSSKLRSDKRKEARKSKMLKAEQRREAVEMEESILVDALEADPQQPAAHRFGQREIETLQRILQEHWDEFHHQRMLYSELADELKTLSPNMSRVKRRILADHVLEAVELLELKADRINRLEKVLASCQVPLTSTFPAKQSAPTPPEERNGQQQPLSRRRTSDEDDENRKQAGSRLASRSSVGTAASHITGGSRNRLREAIDAHARHGGSPESARNPSSRQSHRKSSHTTQARTNSPPTTLQHDS
ncbi:hypothetical protein BCV70DRAFT_198475 [Testicularia cyperi]|uniref:Cep57 centrosome microtubule-binding domain-containing protein n=1 Tax=Testicularia cyperi TaxID=1882483 RepID=A0A317XV72_9BASI|nr:hypothetical protein BCV70DRAFT_198475 [Testicularia cyperi]